MKTPTSRLMCCVGMVLVVATLGFGRAPTPDEALDYAKTVVLVKRVVKDNQVHAYVKEVWRFDAATGPAPAVGSEYGDPVPYSPEMQNPERDGILFAFGPHRPKGLTPTWRIQVVEDGRVPIFQMHVDNVRAAVKTTTPKA